MRETWVRSLGWEDPLEEGMATHCSILAWRIPMDRGAWRTTVHGIAKCWMRLSGQRSQRVICAAPYLMLFHLWVLLPHPQGPGGWGSQVKSEGLGSDWFGRGGGG